MNVIFYEITCVTNRVSRRYTYMITFTLQTIIMRFDILGNRLRKVSSFVSIVGGYIVFYRRSMCRASATIGRGRITIKSGYVPGDRYQITDLCVVFVKIILFWVRYLYRRVYVIRRVTLCYFSSLQLTFLLMMYTKGGGLP